MYICKAKITALLISFAFLTPAVLCAESDLQLDVGFRIAEVSWEDTHTGRNVSVDDSVYGMNVGITNYNVWHIGRSDVVALGFMDSVSASFSEHDATGAMAAIGPAFAAEMGHLLTFQCAAAFALGVIRAEPVMDYSDTAMAMGFALDARVCFVPALLAGPIVGVRYEYSKIDDIFHRDTDRGAFAFYAGVTVRLGKLPA